MKKVFVILVALIGIISCNKDKFQTKPQLTLKSVSNKVVPMNGTLKVELEFTDKEGDIDSVLFIRKERLNKRPVRTTPAPATLRDSLVFKIPDFPNKDRGMISMVLEYERHLKHANTPWTIPNSTDKEPDSLNLKIVLRDKGGNVSDTLSINNVIILRQ